MKEYESTKVGRESKCLPNHFCEYDAYLLEPVDYLTYEFNVILKKKLPISSQSLLHSILSRNCIFRGSFGLIIDDKKIKGFVYQTDSILECNEEFINSLIDYINCVIDDFF